MELLITGATILTCDPSEPDAFTGDLRVVDGRIAGIVARGDGTGGDPVRSDEGDRPGSPAATVVDGTGCIVLPGLIDAHQHMWEAFAPIMHPDTGMGPYFAEWIPKHAPAVTPDSLFETTSGALRRAIASGTTLTFDWCHATNTLQHAEAALAAAAESGSRYIFGYGPPVALGYYGSDRPHPAELEVFAARFDGRQGSRIWGAAALRGPDLSPPGVWRDDIERARAAGLPMSMHVSTRRNGPGSITALHEAGLLGPDMQFVHATDASDAELRLAAQADARFVVPAIAELITGAGDPPLRRMAAQGIPYALGIDTALASPPDMFSQMRAAALLVREAPWVDGAPPPGSAYRRILAAATLDAARAAWIDDVTGSLAPGKSADLVVLRPLSAPTTVEEAYAQVVWSGDAARIESVLIEGREMLPNARR